MHALGLGHLTFLDHTPADLVRLAARAGFGFVGLRLHPVAPGQVSYLPDRAGLAALRSLCRDEGVAVYDIETVVVDAAFDPDTLGPVLAAAQALGASRLNLCADDWDRGALVARIARIAALAAEAGMGIDLEPMAWRGIDSLAKGREVIAASGAHNAGLLIDALHVTRCGGTPGEVAALPGELIRSAQLCDAPLAAPASLDARLAEARSGRLVPGDGHLPLHALVGALPGHCAVSLEVPQAASSLPPEARARHLHAATQALLSAEVS